MKKLLSRYIYGNPIFEEIFRTINKKLDNKYLFIFESDVGIKYRFATYPPEKFYRYCIYELPFEESKIKFNDLVLPPDFLKNKYTICGKNIFESPHIKLFESLDKSISIENTEYVMRRRSGTLDGRLPIQPDPEEIINIFRYRREELNQRNIFIVSVVKIIFREEIKYVIVDGKHRAALIAYLRQPQALRLRFLENDFVVDSFFKKIYTKILESDPQDYSINQEMIWSIVYESFPQSYC